MRLYLTICILFFCLQSYAQQTSSDTLLADTSFVGADTTLVRDTIVAIDTVALLRAYSPPQKFDTLAFSNNAFYKFRNPVRRIINERKWEGKEIFFYSVIGLLIFFALIKNNFYRYLQDLYRTFFRTTLKQRQVREQLMQSPLPSLLMNIFFVVSGAFFLTMIFEYYKLGEEFDFWELLLYCAVGLAMIYFVKFLTLKIFGWLFNISQATDSYIFIVFTANKILGIALLPFIVLLAFTSGNFFQMAITLSFITIGAVFLYRYYISFATIQRQVKINIFHFLLYLLGLEIIPLLLINKLLLEYLA